MDDFGGLGVAADQRGFGRDGETTLTQKGSKMNGSFGGVILQDRSVPNMHLRAIVNPSLDFDWLVGLVHLLKNVLKKVPRVGH